MAETYKITRFFKSSKPSAKIIKKGLTIEQAQQWCKDPESSSITCKQILNVVDTEERGNWFDGYDKE